MQNHGSRNNTKRENELFKVEIISYNFSYHPILSQITDMLNKAFAKTPDNTNLILHSDQGWQYQHKHYQKMLKDKGIRQSMSRKVMRVQKIFSVC